MTYTVGLSQHRDPSTAVGEVVGRVLDDGGPAPDAAVLFFSGSHVAAAADIADAINDLLAPAALVGASACSVAAGEREIEDADALVLWAAWLGGDAPTRAKAVRLGSDLGRPGPQDAQDARRQDALLADAMSQVAAPGGHSLILLADPFSADYSDLLDRWAQRWPQVPVTGGLASAASSPGGNRIVVDDKVSDSGMAALVVGGTARVTHFVSQGCRPVGQPYIITESDGNVIRKLAGKPPLERLQSMFAKLDAADRELVPRGLHVGLVVDENRADFARGDFLVRGVIGADRSSGAIAIGATAPVGTTLQFHVRDARTADEDLAAMIQRHSPTEGDCGALLFTCNGRGSRLFEQPDHDARMLTERTGAELGGMFCAGEIGPVVGRSFVHGFTASVALFSGRGDASGGTRCDASGEARGERSDGRQAGDEQ